MPVCVCVRLISKSTLSQFPRLLSRLYHPENVYIIQFDYEISSYVWHQLIVDGILSAIHAHPTNVHLLAQEPINYRSISMSLNTLSAMTLALEVSSTWGCCINLSGAEMKSRKYVFSPLFQPCTRLRWLRALPLVVPWLSQRDAHLQLSLHRFTSLDYLHRIL